MFLASPKTCSAGVSPTRRPHKSPVHAVKDLQIPRDISYPSRDVSASASRTLYSSFSLRQHLALQFVGALCDRSRSRAGDFTRLRALCKWSGEILRGHVDRSDLRTQNHPTERPFAYLQQVVIARFQQQRSILNNNAIDAHSAFGNFSGRFGRTRDQPT